MSPQPSSASIINRTFTERGALISFIKDHFRAQNIIVVVDKHSDNRKVTFKCYYGGKYRNPLGLTDDTRKRQTGTRLMDCPFFIRANFSKKTGQWTIKKATIVHNHPISDNLGGISTARRLTDTEKTIVRDMANAGTGAASTLAYLREKTRNQWTTKKEIHNEKVVARAEFLDGRSPIQALYDEISTGDFIFNSKVNSNGSISGLFFCHQKSADLARRFNVVFVMDCTYKTNRFGMPLLNIVGITATNSTFNAGFAFICNEIEAMYVWALQSFEFVTKPSIIVTDRELALMSAIAIVFPSTKNLLCIWHVNKNILAYATTKFASTDDTNAYMDDWNQLLYSSSELDFEANWATFQMKWRPSHDALVQYVYETWLIHKDKIVRYWTGRFPHFGMTSTSRIEGNHYVVKRVLGIVNNDLLTVFKKIRLLLDTQLTELNTKMEYDKSTQAHRHALEFMRPLVKKISKHALDKLLEQYKKVIDNNYGDECTGLFRSSFGVPCCHDILRCIQRNERFHLEDIHCQWHLIACSMVQHASIAKPCLSPRKRLMRKIEQRLYETDDDQVVVLMTRLDEASQAPLQSLSNPVVVTRKRGRPAGSKNKKANQREKSLFEYSTGRKCSKCDQAGHNARTCDMHLPPHFGYLPLQY